MVEISNISVNKGTRIAMQTLSSSTVINQGNDAKNKLTAEGGIVFSNYVDSLGLLIEKGLIVLSSRYHYYYDSEEVQNAKTIVYLQEFNQIKEITSLLHSHLDCLPLGCNFVGCFVNNKKVDRFALRKSYTLTDKVRNSDNLEFGIVSRFPLMNMLYSFMDSRTDAFMSEESVALLLDAHGFKIMDITEKNELTYFHSKKVKQSISH